MRIISIELQGYLRLHLAQINYIFIYFTEKIQLILGTNGSGKSSILKELTPLPANSSDYAKDGFKIITIEYKNKTYVLSSCFGKNQPHSFKINGEEQNQSGTLTIQKELVKREFNITQEVHDLMLGQIAFTKMGPNERRNWFTKLNNTDFGYAFSVFQKLKEKHRDLVGAIKLNQTRSVQEANKMLSEDQQTVLVKEIKEYKEFINYLLSQKNNPKQFGHELKKQIQFNSNEINSLTNQIINLRKKIFTIENFNSFSEITERIISLQTEINNLEFLIKLISTDIENYQKISSTLINSNVTNIKDADEKIASLEIKLSSYLNVIEQVNVFPDYEVAKQQLEAIFINVSETLSSLPNNKDKIYSNENYQKALLKHQELYQKKLALETQQNKLFAEKKYQEERKEENLTECPKCLYQWKQGYDEKRYIAILSSLETLGNDLKSNLKETNEVQNEIENIKNYFAIYKSFQNIVSSSTALEPFWKKVAEEKLIFNEPSAIIYKLNQLKIIFSEYEKVKIIQNERSELLKLKQLTEKNDSEQLEGLSIKMNNLNDDLFTKNSKLRFLKGRLSNLKNYQKTVSDLLNIENKLTKLIDERENLYQDSILELKLNLINNLIRDLQLNLAVKEQQLSQVNIQKALVESIEKQLIELNEQAEMTKLLMDELSPTTGLIAKGLLNFIHSFVQLMNSFIRKVWLYPLELKAELPINDEDIDLDYKFSVEVNHSKIIPDIKFTSSAMAEIIDLAFQIVTLKTLGLGDSFLKLDEFGHSMDSAHRLSAFKTINNLIAQSDFSQIFIVSHFESNYGHMKNAEITVLCDKNIVIPPNTNVNNHAIIK